MSQPQCCVYSIAATLVRLYPARGLRPEPAVCFHKKLDSLAFRDVRKQSNKKFRSKFRTTDVS